jgi:hypothetical protein
MYAPFALALRLAHGGQPIPSARMPVDGRLQRFMDPSARVIDKNASLPLGSRHTLNDGPTCPWPPLLLFLSKLHCGTVLHNLPTRRRNLAIAPGSDLQQVQASLPSLIPTEAELHAALAAVAGPLARVRARSTVDCERPVSDSSPSAPREAARETFSRRSRRHAVKLLQRALRHVSERAVSAAVCPRKLLSGRDVSAPNAARTRHGTLEIKGNGIR